MYTYKMSLYINVSKSLQVHLLMVKEGSDLDAVGRYNVYIYPSGIAGFNVLLMYY